MEKGASLLKLDMHLQVAAGVGQMLFLADSESETVKKLEEFQPEVEVEPSKGEEEVAAAAGGKGGASESEIEQLSLFCCSEYP